MERRIGVRRLVCGIGALTALAACSGGGAAGQGALGAARQADAPVETTLGTTTTTTPATTTSTPAATTTSPVAVSPEMQRAPSTTAVAARNGNGNGTTAPPPAPGSQDDPPAAAPTTAPPAGPRPANGTPTALGNCTLFPRSSYWYANVSTLPVHTSSASYITSIGATAGLKADFGSGLWDGGPIGIPYVVVPAGQPKVPVSFDYADESEPGPYPIPADAPIEGGAQSDGDRHILVVDQTDCTLYETWSTYPDGAGWKAGSGAVFDLSSNALRPDGWTSADAAGLPILPGLVRYDEIAAGHIDHAIRITVPRTQKLHVWPARHDASSRTDPNLPPMGLWLRLRADFDTSGFPREAQIILEALKQHGAIVADNGSAWYMSGAPDERWNNDALATLRRVPGSAFEAIDATSLIANPNSGQVR
jgi:hypothetical protein